MMIELNLMPGDMRPVEKKKKASLDLSLPDIPVIPAVIVIIALLISGQLMLGFVSFIQKRQLSSVSGKISDIASQRTAAIDLKKEADELDLKFTAMEGLTQGSLVWSKKLSDLSDAIVDGIWLDSLTLDIETPLQARPHGSAAAAAAETTGRQQVLVLMGFAISSSRAEETATIGKFIDSLKKNNDFFRDFYDIRLSSIHREFYGKADVMKFTIVCYFKPDRSYFEKLQRSAY